LERSFILVSDSRSSNKAEIILPGLFETSYQGDSKVAEIFQLLGIESIYGNKTVTLKKDR